MHSKPRQLARQQVLLDKRSGDLSRAIPNAQLKHSISISNADDRRHRRSCVLRVDRPSGSTMSCLLPATKRVGPHTRPWWAEAFKDALKQLKRGRWQLRGEPCPCGTALAVGTFVAARVSLSSLWWCDYFGASLER